MQYALTLQGFEYLKISRNWTISLLGYTTIYKKIIEMLKQVIIEIQFALTLLHEASHWTRKKRFCLVWGNEHWVGNSESKNVLVMTQFVHHCLSFPQMKMLVKHYIYIGMTVRV